MVILHFPWVLGIALQMRLNWLIANSLPDTQTQAPWELGIGVMFSGGPRPGPPPRGTPKASSVFPSFCSSSGGKKHLQSHSEILASWRSVVPHIPLQCLGGAT